LLQFKKTVRIAVTGDVLLTDIEAKVIDTRSFQRLRGIRQLGTVNFVYPTALHTRFDHSLGTLAKADEMILAIAKNAKSVDRERQITLEQRLLARMYGLLHDITHVPFGHTIEDELRILRRHDDNPTRIVRFLGPQSEIGEILANGLKGTKHYSDFDDFYDRLMRIFLWEDDREKRKKRDKDKEGDWSPLKPWLDMRKDEVFIHDIVSDTVCADLLDYLARDNYFCNLSIPLEYRFINFLYLKPDQQEKPRKGVRRKRRVFVRLWKKEEKRPRRDLLTDLTRLMEARYMVGERAYFHHTKLVTGAMLGRALAEFYGDAPNDSYLYDKSDDTLLEAIRVWEDGDARTDAKSDRKSESPLALADRLQRRELHKTIAVYGDKAFENAQWLYHRAVFKEEALTLLQSLKTRKEVEDRLAAEIGHRRGSILIYAPPAKMNMKVASVKVHWEGKDRTLSEINDPVVEQRLESLLKSHQSLWAIRLFADGELTDEEQQMVRESFELQFLVPYDKRDPRRRLHTDRVVQKQLHRLYGGITVDTERYNEAVRAASISLLDEAARSEGYKERLATAARRAYETLTREG
jgi:HD superfamily phosphohydrolase